MHKEERPQPYERRILDTKGLAQRLDLNYIRRPHWLRTIRWALICVALSLAVAAALPILAGLPGGERSTSPGPLRNGHAAMEKNCRDCHSKQFAPVNDDDCRTCHTGSLRHFDAEATPVSHAPPCADCHQEHRGNQAVSSIADANCTRCHADLSSHGNAVTLLGASRRITKFAFGSHPRFSANERLDERPLKLNHAIHMALQAASNQPGMKLPMLCIDCHQMAPRHSAFDMVPVSFDAHCASCHAAELAFDTDQVLDASAAAPHLKDVHAIRDYVYNAYRRALQQDPSLWHRPAGNGKVFAPVATPQAWLEAVTGRSVNYLFERKCIFCHEIQSKEGVYPVIRKVNQISGQYSAKRAAGVAWFTRAEFSHPMHRTSKCESCHSAARQSVKTSDVLIPDINACLQCHGSSGTFLDGCSECHVYHDRSQETARENRINQELLRQFTPIPGAAADTAPPR